MQHYRGTQGWEVGVKQKWKGGGHHKGNWIPWLRKASQQVEAHTIHSQMPELLLTITSLGFRVG
jgi:hypothetical protein